MKLELLLQERAIDYKKLAIDSMKGILKADHLQHLPEGPRK
jgi:hypothetical protein